MSSGDQSSPTSGPTHSRPALIRESDQRTGVGGVARAIATSIGVEPTTVRLVFAISALFNGIGLFIYGFLWAVLPDRQGRVPANRVGLRIDVRRNDPVMAGAFAMLVTGALMLIRQTGLWFPSSYIWPLVALAVGLGVVWQPGNSGRSGLAAGRWLIGGVLVVIGFGSLFGSGRSFSAARQMLLDSVVVLAGISLLVGPLVTRLIRRLRAEEQRRATSEAKADVAAHLHDSVLQTLALIQKRADQPGQVTMIARRQERELREWLYGTPRRAEESLSAALQQVANDLEADHGVPIDIVTVGGDLAITAANMERIDGLLAAVREAISNSARHSHSPKVSVYVEIEPDALAVYVRDTGIGFDRAAVDATRRGVVESIEGRMRRIGGTATIRSTHQVGTNVELRLSTQPEVN
jgi:signal transduction histidine kinase